MECAIKEKSCETVGSSNLNIIQQYYKDALKSVAAGLNLEEGSEKINEAIASYRNGLRFCEAGINLPYAAENLNNEDKEKYKKVVASLTRISEEIKERLVILNNDEDVTSFDELNNLSVVNEMNSNHNKNKICSKQDDLPVDESKDKTWQDVQELLRIEEGVNMLHVDNKGSVSTWMLPCNIEIFQIIKQSIEKISPAGFIKCGDWIYPLEPGKSPVLKTKKKTYMFPDLSESSQQQVSEASTLPCIGIILSEIVPEKLVKRFERILSCYCDFRVEKPVRPPLPSIQLGENQLVAPSAPSEDQIVVVPSAPSEDVIEEIIASPASGFIQNKWPDRITSGIRIGSQWISWGFVKGAECATSLVEKGAQSLRKRIKPNKELTLVDPDLSRNIRHLYQATGSIVQISTFLLSTLGAMTVLLGKKLAPHIEHHGQKLLPANYQYESNEKNKQTVENVKKVASASLEGFGLIFLALEQAGANLYKGISLATVQTLEHRYGNEVGEITQDAMGVAGNTMQAYWNLKKLGAKAVAKRVVKDTGKACVLDHSSVPK
ncbi:spartin isoform X2 [Hydra vulgaris]|uniref:Spartin isoform X2 n=1 Tax=Hydra vulgaris TaxID=6087 RepID=A0ABM4CWK8_HYDVU